MFYLLRNIAFCIDINSENYINHLSLTQTDSASHVAFIIKFTIMLFLSSTSVVLHIPVFKQHIQNFIEKNDHGDEEYYFDSMILGD